MHALPPLIDVALLPGVEGEPAWVPQVLCADELSRWTSLHATGRPLFLAAHLGARMVAARRLAWTGDPPTAPDLARFCLGNAAFGKADADLS